MGCSYYTYCHRHRRVPMRPPCRKQVKQLPFSFCVLICSASTPTLLAEVKWLKMNSWGREWEGGLFHCINRWGFFQHTGVYMFNFVRTCSVWWESRGFITGSRKSPLFWFSDKNGSEELFRHSQACHTGYPPRLSSKWRSGAGNMAQRLRMLATLSEDWSLVPSTHIRWFTTACNSSCRDFNTLFWVLLAPAHMHKHADT